MKKKNLLNEIKFFYIKLVKKLQLLNINYNIVKNTKNYNTGHDIENKNSIKKKNKTIAEKYAKIMILI